jgi:O-antigen/teichoic acid export membrane protein
VLGQGLLVAISPLLTRIYTPADFGALAIITALSGVLGTFVTLCWEAAMVIPRTQLIARAVAYLGLLTTIVLSLVITAASFIWREQLATLLGSPALVHYWWVVPLTVFIIGVFKVSSAWVVRMQEYGRIAWRNATQGVGQAICNLALGVLGYTPLGLILGVAFGRAVALWGLLGRRSFLAGGLPSYRTLRLTAIRYRRFPLVTSWSYTLNSLGLQLPIVLLSIAYQAYEVGLLALTIRVLASPVSIVADAVSQYFEGSFGARIRDSGIGLTRQIRRIVARLSLAASVPILIVVAASPFIFTFVFGAEWSAAGTFAQVMALGYFAQFVVAPISKALTLLERQDLQFYWDMTRAVLTAGAVLLAFGLGLPIIWAIAFLSIAQALSYAAMLLITLTVASRYESQSSARGAS